MKKLVVATRNQGKLIEIAELLHRTDIKLYSLQDFPDAPEVNEDGKTFMDNAIKKAKSAFKHMSLPCIADDSGLEVDALHGKPGVRSSRYAGEDAGDDENIEKLLDALKDVPLEKRTARFGCVIAFIDTEGKVFTTEGTCEGLIGYEKQGAGGFGYDPVFIVREYGKTFAELGSDIKNRISHRAIALSRMMQILEDHI